MLPGPTTSSTATPCPASSRSGGAIRRAASGSSPSVIPPAIRSCAPTLSESDDMSRLPPVTGELIDRKHVVDFSFEGRHVHGFRGDTISSALAASGVTVFGRSFKYHRPRGLLSAANHDVNAMVQVRAADRSVPNVRADMVPVEAGWDVRAVNTLGGLELDRLAVLNRLCLLPGRLLLQGVPQQALVPALGAHVPQSHGSWQRRSAGAAAATPKRYDFCDVLVIGAGPVGTGGGAGRGRARRRGAAGR